MRKRIAALALAAVMAFGLTACGGGSSSSTAASAGSGDAAGGVSGEFTGTATGMGEVSVTITLTDGVITGCEIVGDSETEGIGSVIVENAPEEIVSGNKGAIDVVSGATITSNAVNEALAAALAAAGLDAADFTGSGDAAAAEDRAVDTDIVIVGAGGAGMTAAIAAANEGKNVVINVKEVRRPDCDAQLVAESVAAQLEKRVSFRRCMKQSIQRSMRARPRPGGGPVLQLGRRHRLAERAGHRADQRFQLWRRFGQAHPPPCGQRGQDHLGGQLHDPPAPGQV